MAPAAAAAGLPASLPDAAGRRHSPVPPGVPGRTVAGRVAVYDVPPTPAGGQTGTRPDTMLSYSAATLAGFILLMWGADRFVIGAAGTARNLGVPPLLIGLTLVGMATSGPEIFVSVTASLAGDPALAAGNAIGSNIANIGLVLGMTALILPISVRSETLRRELPALLAVTLIMTMVFFNLRVGRIEGVLLMVTLVLLLYWLVVLGSRSGASDPIALGYDAEIPRDITMRKAITWLVIGLVVLLTGSNLLVWGAQHLAIEFGVSELVIGLTVVAIGTSLPELAVSILSAFKGEHDMAIGNIIGSNLFNSLAVVGIAGIIHPAVYERELLSMHLPVMIGLTLALFLLTYNFAGDSRIRRLEGAMLLGAFFIYHGWLITR
jgi:cation:H+ antiporter